MVDVWVAGSMGRCMVGLVDGWVAVLLGRWMAG